MELNIPYNMKTNLYIVIMLGIIGISACKSVDPAKKDSLVKQITESENKIYADSGFKVNPIIAVKVINLYTQFADQFPDDSLAPGYLFKSAEIYMNLNAGQKAVTYYNKVYSQYPNYKKAAVCLFLQAFIYETQLGDLVKAKDFYSKFISEFPTHELVRDAKASIENLGKSPEELIRSFEQKNSQKKDSIPFKK